MIRPDVQLDFASRSVRDEGERERAVAGDALRVGVRRQHPVRQDRPVA